MRSLWHLSYAHALTGLILTSPCIDVEFATVIKHKNSGYSNGTFDLSTSEIMTKHIIESNLNLTRDSKAKAMIQDLVTGLRATFGPGTELSSKLDRMYADNGIVAKNVFTARKFELELMNAGKVSLLWWSQKRNSRQQPSNGDAAINAVLPLTRFLVCLQTTLPRDILFDKYVPFVRQRMGRLYRDYSSLSALDYHRVDAQAIRDVLDPPEPDMDADMDADIPSMMGGTGDAAHAGGGWSGSTDHSHMDLFAAFGSGDVQTRHAGLSTNPLHFPDSEAASALQARPTDMGNRAPNRNPARHNSTGDESFSTAPTATTTPLSKTAKTAKTPPTGSSGNRGQARRRESVEEEEDEDDDNDDDEDDEEEEEGQYGDGQHYGQPSGTGLSSTPSDGCFLCDYKPSGDPRWFAGSMSKHMKTKHSGVTKVFKCPHVGCNSKYTNRPDNLRQHQMKKRHFSSAEEEAQIMEAAAARAENRKRRKTK